MSNTIRTKPYWINLQFLGEHKFHLAQKCVDGKKFSRRAVYDAFRCDKFRGYAEVWSAAGKRHCKRKHSRHVRRWNYKYCRNELINIHE